MTEASPLWFTIGQRVELHPATDAWMSGDRYGEVIKIGRKYVSVKMDRSGKVRQMPPESVNDINY